MFSLHAAVRLGTTVATSRRISSSIRICCHSSNEALLRTLEEERHLAAVRNRSLDSLLEPVDKLFDNQSDSTFESQHKAQCNDKELLLVERTERICNSPYKDTVRRRSCGGSGGCGKRRQTRARRRPLVGSPAVIFTYQLSAGRQTAQASARAAIHFLYSTAETVREPFARLVVVIVVYGAKYRRGRDPLRYRTSHGRDRCQLRPVQTNIPASALLQSCSQFASIVERKAQLTTVTRCKRGSLVNCVAAAAAAAAAVDVLFVAATAAASRHPVGRSAIRLLAQSRVLTAACRPCVDSSSSSLSTSKRRTSGRVSSKARVVATRLMRMRLATTTTVQRRRRRRF